MRKIYALAFFLVASFYGHAQVGIGTSIPDNSAQLDVVAEDKGVLIPRVALNGIVDQTTIANGNVESLLVFNTADTADVKPGYYYWYDGRWRRVVSAEDVINGDVPDNIVIFNSENNSFTYLDESGTTQEINLEELIRLNETVTTLVDEGNGTYTYTSEDNTVTLIDVPSDIIKQITNKEGDVYKSITNLIEESGNGNVTFNGDTNEFTYIDENGEAQTINLDELVKMNESITTLTANSDGTYTYTSEDNTVTLIDVPSDIIEQITNKEGDVYKSITNLIEESGNGNVTFNGDTNEFTYIDENGEAQTINLDELVKMNESITTLTANSDGTYTYTSEDNTVTLIDVPSDIIKQITNKEGDVYKSITNLIEESGNGNVTFNGDTNEFTYIDENGEA
ncbi:hypothetical protein ACVBDU_19155, partial [Sinomicrobium sp. M5D2P9]